MVPQHHGFVPGGRPSERGMLYRHTNINMYCRLGPIQHAQRTPLEGKIFLCLVFPDQILNSFMLLIVGSGVMWLMFRQQRFSWQTNKNHWMQGGMTQHELFQRNSDLTTIFEKHREELENTRKAIGGRPEIFQPAPDKSIGQWQQA